jgi:hypothetical protein
MSQDLSPLVQPGAAIACQIAWGDRPVYTAIFDAGDILEQLRLNEIRHGLSPEDRDRPEAHAHLHRLTLALIRDNADPDKQDWVTVAGAAFLWSGFNHPAFARVNVLTASLLLERTRRATMCMEIRAGALWFEMFDLPLPAEATPVNAHADPA